MTQWTNRGRRLGYLVIIIILWGLDWMGLINELLSSFFIGVCFGLIFLSIQRENEPQ